MFFCNISFNFLFIFKICSAAICISVACFDLGEVARYHPLGRKIMNDLGIKLDLLQLTNHENAEIKKNAIYAVQKIMLHHWDLVQND